MAVFNLVTKTFFIFQHNFIDFKKETTQNKDRIQVIKFKITEQALIKYLLQLPSKCEKIEHTQIIMKILLDSLGIILRKKYLKRIWH